MTFKHDIAILWIRQCLRLDDNPALQLALSQAKTIVPVYIYAPHEEGPLGVGSASQWWLHHSLAALQKRYAEKNACLILRQGSSASIIEQLIQETGATAVYFDSRLEPPARQQEQNITQRLQQQGIDTQGVLCNFLLHPEAVWNQQRLPFKVFTPFYKHSKTLLLEIFKLIPEPHAIPFNPDNKPTLSLDLDDLQLLSAINWASRFNETGTPGEREAQNRLSQFTAHAVSQYETFRDRPDYDGVSKLSPALHFGEISPRQIANSIQGLPHAEVYYRQLFWREFAHYILYHFPFTQSDPFQKQFETFPWEDNAEFLRRWQQGETGYPIVDAGMRELWAIGWMHNRVRMIVASFLTKDLLIHWQAGAEWFWETLVDADLANNTMGWQWTAGCGVDAAPYFRVFNPTLQAERFDPEGAYVRKWIPELKLLPNKLIHQPWLTSDYQHQYPAPIVNHAEAKEKALQAYKSLKRAT